MSWHWAMNRAWDCAMRYPGRRFRVYGVKLHDEAGLVPDEWIYKVEFAS